VTTRAFLDLPAPTPHHVISYGDDRNQFGHLWLPTGCSKATPVAMLIHGGYWRSAFGLEHMGHIAADLCAQGLAVWNVEYRRLGQPGGGFPGTGNDVRAAYSHLETITDAYSFDRTNIVLVGFSAGGQLAAWLGSVMPVSGVVSLAGVLDLRRAHELGLSEGVVGDFMGGSPAERPTEYDAFDPTSRIPLRSPMQLFHGTDDVAVPLEISQRFKAAAAPHATLTVLPGAGHFELIDPTTVEYTLIRNAITTFVGR
jgi:acetyl esterase/lipase